MCSSIASNCSYWVFTNICLRGAAVAEVAPFTTSRKFSFSVMSHLQRPIKYTPFDNRTTGSFSFFPTESELRNLAIM